MRVKNNAHERNVLHVREHYKLRALVRIYSTYYRSYPRVYPGSKDDKVRVLKLCN